MADSNTPLISTQPGQKTRMWRAMEQVMRQFSLRFDHCLPAQVISYNRPQNQVMVQPMIDIVKLDGTTMPRNSLANVPALALGAGGFVINFPIAQGDLGWIFATDRDYSEFIKNLSQSAPNTSRAHRFEDSLFVPDEFRKYTIAEADANAMVIQTLDGTTKISISAGTINIVAPTAVNVTTPTATFSQNVQINGNLTVAQNATVDGTLTNNGINVTQHGHQSTSPGSRTGNMEA